MYSLDTFTFTLSDCYGEKIPMVWGVPQQIARHEKLILSQYAIEAKHITLRDL